MCGIFGLGSNSLYSQGERIFRMAVFQNGAGITSWFDQFLLWAGAAIDQKTCFPHLYEEDRAKLSRQAFKQLGAKMHWITPQDEQAELQCMTLKAADLEKKLLKKGASWKKLEIIQEDGETKSILAIIPPEDESDQEWLELKGYLLKLKWKEKTVEIIDNEFLDVIVTCEEADLIEEEDFSKHLFLHANSGSVTFEMLWNRAGWILGTKQNACFFNQRGSGKSSGLASEAGYYNDIKAIYEKVVLDGLQFSPKNVWITGACRGVTPAAYLKAELHDEGVNLVLENGYGDLEQDFIAQQGCFNRSFAHRYWGGLECRDINDSDLKPRETGFNIPKLWEFLEKRKKGKVIIVGVENDQFLPVRVTDDLENVAKRVNKHVYRISFNALGADHHFDRYFNYSDSRRRALSIIFDRE